MSTGDAWDPAQYERFREQRKKPFFDLLATVAAKPGMRVVDLGCGTGENTRFAHDELKARSTLGLDNSEAMLARAGALVVDGLAFAHADIARFPDGAEGVVDFDVVLSNAALQWVPDHEALFARLVGLLAPGGQLAVQMPANQDHPDHVVAAELAREAPFAAPLGGEGPRQHILAPERYAVLLSKLGLLDVDVFLRVYVHEMPSRDGVIEWVKGAMLTDVKARLSEALYADFVARYSERLLARLDDDRPYFYTLKRIFLSARKP